jgi:acyl-CoA synthetase (AMP-forming)/AMP-acid ligase II
MLTPVVSGCTMIVQPYFNAGEALELMERHRCNVLMGHQPHFIEYLNHRDLPKRKLVLEKDMIFASPEVNKRVHDEMGIMKLISPYGLTETHIGGTACELEDPLELRMTSVGRPMPGVEIAIREPNGEESLPAGEPGEVCFRGWCVTKGYVDDPEKSAESIDADGWFRTGDIGVIASGGYLRLVGRIKDYDSRRRREPRGGRSQGGATAPRRGETSGGGGHGGCAVGGSGRGFRRAKERAAGDAARANRLLPPTNGQLQSAAPC